MATVSWLLPVKNGLPFLPETLASLAAQTRRDFEVLAWDNGSTDGTLAELDRWIPHRLPGRVIRDRPLTLAASLGALVETANTDWCARIDADDVAEPDRLDLQCAHLTRHPEVACIGSRYTAIDRDGREVPLNYPVALGYRELQDRLLSGNAISHPSVLFRREAVLAVGNYRERGDPAHVEDYDLWLRLCSHFRVESLPARLVRYRIHDRNVTFASLRSGQLRTAMDAVWLRHAGVFAGLADAALAGRLRSGTCDFALPHFLTVARHLGRRDGVSGWRRLSRSAFRDFCRGHTAVHDRITRGVLRSIGLLLRLKPRLPRSAAHES